MSNNNTNTGNTNNTNNTNNNSNPAEEAGSQGPPVGSASSQIADAMNTQIAPEFGGFNFDFDESHSDDHGSASSTSDTDTPGELLCNLCGRRREWVRYVVCGHKACASCTKKLWWSRINRPDRARDPWPTSFPCPFCRADVTKVVDGRDDAVGGGYATVSVPTATATATGTGTATATAIGAGTATATVIGAGTATATATGTAGAPVVNGGTTGTTTGNSGAGVAASGGGQGMLIVDWMLMRSGDAAWRLRLETAERAAATERAAAAAAGGSSGAANNGAESAATRAYWQGADFPEWN